jgi:hypothetical protein
LEDIQYTSILSKKNAAFKEQLKTAENNSLYAIAAFIAATFSFKFNASEGFHKSRIEYIWKFYAKEKALPNHIKNVKNWISSIGIIFSEYQRGDK